MNHMSFIVLENSLLQEIKEAQLDNPYAQQARSKLDACIEVSEEPSSSTSSLQHSSSPYANFSMAHGCLKWKGKIYVPCA